MVGWTKKIKLLSTTTSSFLFGSICFAQESTQDFSDSSIRLMIFVLALVFFSALEFFFSYRKRNLSRTSRWPANFGLIIIASLMVKVLLPTGMIFFTDWAKDTGFGLLNFFEFSMILKVVISLFALDFAIYVQHIIFHKVRFFWIFHRVHHADVDLDTTSALRFHPIEIIFSIMYKIIVLLFLGVPGEAVLIFEIILNLMAMFNHSNLKLPKPMESFLRLVIVTPQMHIIHHSVEQKESDMNYGFNLSIWDRMFKTYINDFDSSGQVGQKYYRTQEHHNFLSILTLPFKKVD